MSVPVHSGFPRRHASGGQVYTVEIAPAEGARGVESFARAIVFTRDADGGVVVARVPALGDPRWLTGSDLDDLLARAG